MQLMIFLYVYFSLLRQSNRPSLCWSFLRARSRKYASAAPGTHGPADSLPGAKPKKLEGLTQVDFVTHATISTMSFAILSMFEGPPFTLWGAADRGPARWIPLVLLSFFILMMGMLSEPYNTSKHIDKINIRAARLMADLGDSQHAPSTPPQPPQAASSVQLAGERRQREVAGSPPAKDNAAAHLESASAAAVAASDAILNPAA